MSWLKEENMRLIEEGYSLVIRFLVMVFMCLIVGLFWWVMFSPYNFEFKKNV